MANLGVLCLPIPSHMNLFLALGRTLADRGHEVTFFTITEHEAKIRGAGLGFRALEPSSVPAGTLSRMMHQMGELGHLGAMRLQGKFDEIRYHGILQKGRALVSDARLDGMIVDQAEACGGSIAESLGLPWISVCSGLCLNAEPEVPPFFTPWGFSRKPGAVMRNRLAYLGSSLASRSLQTLINSYRKSWGLPLLGRLDDTFSPYAQVSQQNRDFDFPRRHLPPVFHYVGPIRYPAERPVEFPWTRLDGSPLIYASLGTLVNRHKHLYQLIADACEGLDAQLVLSLGGAERGGEALRLPKSAVVVPFAPQLELLARAAVTVTHGGLNTTLESLAQGVPLVALPITFEQPAIAARIRWTGVGEFLSINGLKPDRLRSAIRRVLTNPSYRVAADRMREGLSKSRGAIEASEIIERVVHTGRPVPAHVDALTMESAVSAIPA